MYSCRNPQEIISRMCASDTSKLKELRNDYLGMCIRVAWGIVDR